MYFNEETIIIAEDDDGNFVLTERYLRRAGFENDILRFKDGDHLLRFFDSCIFKRRLYRDVIKHILILDINMPKKSGLQVLSEMNAKNILAHIPTIVFSCSADTDIIKKCSKYNNTKYVHKPPTPQLIDAINGFTAQCSYAKSSAV